jgi:hypothetical protein
MQLSDLIDKGEKDVLDCSYIVDCVNAGQLLPLKRLYFLGFSPQSWASFRLSCDAYGDSYTEELQAKDLPKLSANIAAAVASAEAQAGKAKTAEKVTAKVGKAGKGGKAGKAEKEGPVGKGKKAVQAVEDETEKGGFIDAEEQACILRDWRELKGKG